MKKAYFFAVLLLVSNNLFSQIPNPSFEDWNSVHKFSIPKNSGNDSLANTSASYFFNRTGDAGIGRYDFNEGSALGLNNVNLQSTNPDDGTGSIAYAKIENDKWIHTIPMTFSSPDSLIMTCQYSISNLDSATIYLGLSGSNFDGFNRLTFKFAGNNESMQNISFDLPDGYKNIEIDSVYLIMTSGDLLNNYIDVNNHLFVDNIKLKSSTSEKLIPGLDFEEWEDFTRNEIAEWTTTNTLESRVIYETSESTDGSSAITLESFGYYNTSSALDSAKSTLLLGVINDQGSIFPGAALEGEPSKLSFDYKFNNPGDTASVSVFLSRWNDVSEKTSLVQFNQRKLYVSAEYTTYEIDFSGISSTPDSIAIYFLSSAGTPRPGSKLTIDNIKLEYSPITVGTNDFARVGFGSLPNPSNGNIEVFGALPGSSIRVTDLNGTLVYEDLLSSSLQIDLTTLNKGTYILQAGGNKELIIVE